MMSAQIDEVDSSKQKCNHVEKTSEKTSEKASEKTSEKTSDSHVHKFEKLRFGVGPLWKYFVLLN